MNTRPTMAEYIGPNYEDQIKVLKEQVERYRESPEAITNIAGNNYPEAFAKAMILACNALGGG